MSLTAVVERVESQAVGSYITVRYDTPGGTASYRRVHFVADGVDPQAAADAHASRVEAHEKRAELRHARALAFSGVNPGLLPLYLATTSEMVGFVVRSAANLGRSGDFSRAHQLRNVKLSVFDNYSDAQIAAQLAGVSAPQVAAWRTKLDNIVTALDAYTPGFSEQEVG